MDLTTLERLARDYGLGPFSSSRLQSLASDPSFAQWASQNLHPDNLLAPFELTTYTTLQNSGTVSRLSASEDLTSLALPTLTHSELQSAILTLRSSTAQITSQTQTLTQQAAALSKLTTKNQQQPASFRATVSTLHSTRLGNSLATTQDSIAALTTTLHQKASGLSALSSTTTSSLPSTLTSLLIGDDRLLASLSKLAPELTSSYASASTSSSSLSEIQTRSLHLIKTTVELIRTHLDRTYLDSLSAPLSHEEGDLSLESTEALAAEVESLYAEVVPVAQMSVQSVWIESAREEIGSSASSGLRRTAAGLRYMSEVLSHLLRRISLLEARFNAVLAHAATTDLVVSATEEELSTPISPPSSPPRRRRSTITGPTTPGPRRNFPAKDDTPLLFHALTTLSIPLPDPSPSNNNPTSSTLLTTLQQTTAHRSQKFSILSLAAQASFESTTAHILSDSQRDVSVLRAGLAAEYPFGEIALTDPDMAESLGWLAREVADVEGRLGDMTIRKAEGTEKREEFVATWC